MLKHIKNRLRNRRKSELKLTPGESIRDAIINAGIEAAKESGYAAGDRMEKFVEIASKVGNFIDHGTELVGESASPNRI